jgi:hypothetical protein
MYCGKPVYILFMTCPHCERQARTSFAAIEKGTLEAYRAVLWHRHPELASSFVSYPPRKSTPVAGAVGNAGGPQAKPADAGTGAGATPADGPTEAPTPPAEGPDPELLPPAQPADPATIGPATEREKADSAPLSPISPPADVVDRLRRDYGPIQAALVEYLLPRKKASFRDIKRDVHKDPDVSDGAVRQRVSEARKSLATIGSKLMLSTAGDWVYLDDPPE